MYFCYRKGYHQNNLRNHHHLYENNYLPVTEYDETDNTICLSRQNTHTKMHSETDFSNNSDYNEYANEIPFVGNIV